MTEGRKERYGHQGWQREGVTNNGADDRATNERITWGAGKLGESAGGRESLRSAGETAIQ